MDYFGNNGFTPLVNGPQSGFINLSEHNWMQSDAGQAEFYAELARLYQHPDHYFPSYYPPQGPAPTPHYDHNMQRHPWVHPVNNYTEPEEVD